MGILLQSYNIRYILGKFIILIPLTETLDKFKCQDLDIM